MQNDLSHYYYSHRLIYHFRCSEALFKFFFDFLLEETFLQAEFIKAVLPILENYQRYRFNLGTDEIIKK